MSRVRCKRRPFGPRAVAGRKGLAAFNGGTTKSQRRKIERTPVDPSKSWRPW